MPWARFDDRFPSNRKIRKLSDAAFRLYVSAVCWSGENLTDGFVADDDLMIVSDVRDPETAAEELVRRELWEQVAGGWLIHDYFDYNPRAAQVKAEREAKSARQQRWRENKRSAEFGISAAVDDANVDASTDASRDGDVDASVEGAPRARVPAPSRPVPEQQQQEQPRARAEAGQPNTDGAPVWAVPLIDQLTTEGFVVAWDLGFAEWDTIRVAIDRSGIPAMVAHVHRRHQAAKTAAYSARAWIKGWKTLPVLDIGSAPPQPPEREADVVPIGRQRNGNGHEPFRNPPASAYSASW